MPMHYFTQYESNPSLGRTAEQAAYRLDITVGTLYNMFNGMPPIAHVHITDGDYIDHDVFRIYEGHAPSEYFYYDTSAGTYMYSEWDGVPWSEPFFSYDGDCPNCGGRIMFDESGNEYCMDCGQFVKRSNRRESAWWDDDYDDGYSGDGDCFVVALENIMADHTLYVCHGIVHGQGNLYGIVYPHAWNETDDGYVIDQSNGNDIYMPKGEYYGIGKIDPADVRKYNFEEAAREVLRTNVYGPWDKAFDFDYREAKMARRIMTAAQRAQAMKKMAQQVPPSDISQWDIDAYGGNVFYFWSLFCIADIQDEGIISLSVQDFTGGDYRTIGEGFDTVDEAARYAYDWAIKAASSKNAMKKNASTWELARQLFVSLVKMDYPYTEYAIQNDGYTVETLAAATDDEAISMFLEKYPNAVVYDAPENIDKKWASEKTSGYPSNADKCPFCGNTHLATWEDIEMGWCISCDSCNAMITGYNSEDAVVDRWNYRVASKRKADFWNPLPMTEALMDIDNDIWDVYGWTCGNDVQANWETYKREVAQSLDDAYIDKSDITQEVIDDLEDNNFHSLIRALKELNMVTASKKSSRRKGAGDWTWFDANISKELEFMSPQEIFDMYGAYTDESYCKTIDGMMGVVSHHVGQSDDWWTWDTYAGYFSYGIDCGLCDSLEDGKALCEKSFADPGFTVYAKMARNARR